MNFKKVINNYKTWYLTFSILSLFFFYWITPNIPFLDDMGRSFRVIENYRNLKFVDFLEFLFTHQTNEHRIIPFRLVVLFNHLFCYSINFKILVTAGNIFFFITLYNIVELIENKTFKTLLPIFLIIFCPLYLINNWALQSLVISTVFLFAYSSLNQLVSKSHKSFYIALLLAILATFSFGIGFFTFICGTLILLFNNAEKKKLFIWITIALLTVILYFHNLQIPDHRPTLLIKLNQDLMSIIMSPFIFASAYFKDSISLKLIQLMIGLISYIFIIYTLFKKWLNGKNTLLLYGMLLFVILVYLSGSVSRGYLGLHIPLADRYQFYHTIFYLLIFIIGCNSYQIYNTKWYKYALILLILILGNKYYSNIKMMVNNKHKLEHQYQNFCLGIPKHKFQVGTLNRALKNGYYLEDKDIYTEFKPKEYTGEINQRNLKLTFNNLKLYNDYFKVNGVFKRNVDVSLLENIQLVLQNQNKLTYLLDLDLKYDRRGIVHFLVFMKNRDDNKIIQKDSLYKFGMYYEIEGKSYVHFENDFIKL